METFIVGHRLRPGCVALTGLSPPLQTALHRSPELWAVGVISDCEGEAGHGIRQEENRFAWIDYLSPACAEIGYQPDPRLSELMSHLRRSSGSQSQETIAYLHLLPREPTGAPLLTEKRELGGCYERTKELGFSVDEFAWVPAQFSSVMSAVRLIPLSLQQNLMANRCSISFDSDPDSESYLHS